MNINAIEALPQNTDPSITEEDNKKSIKDAEDDQTTYKERQQQEEEETSEFDWSATLETDDTIDSPYTPHNHLMDATHSNFGSNPNIKIIVANPTRRVWSLGSRYIVKEWICPYNDGNIEANATKLLKDRGVNVPIPNIVTSWKDGDWAFMISERLPGQPLMDIWAELSTEDKCRIAKQTADMVSKFRSITSNTCCAFDGQSIKDVNMLLGAEGRKEFDPLTSDAEVWEQMFRSKLDEVNADEEHRRLLRKYMPRSGPYVFTHGDLSFSNIVVDDDRNVSGILDFEFSAYLPVWWEYVAAHFSFSQGDEEWKDILRQYLEPHEQAINWYMYWAELCKTPMPEDIDVWAQILSKFEQL